MTIGAFSWAGRTVFVTGATGFVGSWVVPELLARGASVVALLRGPAPSSRLARDGWLDRVSVVHGTLADEGLVRRTLTRHRVDTVFHLAAQTQVAAAQLDPVATLEANVRGTWLLLDAVRECGTPRVVVASSEKAYGHSNALPYREDHPLQGCFPYDVSKSCADLITTMYARSFGVGAVTVRCGNLFGGGDLNFDRLVPGVILATLRNERFMIRSDGKFVRDFLYVEDAADAYVRAAERLGEEPALAGEAFNFGTDQHPTILDLAHRILALMGRTDLEPVVQNVASAEIREQYLDARKARERLGWSPRHGLDEGLRRTVDWYRRFFEDQPGRPAPSMQQQPQVHRGLEARENAS